MEEYLTGDEVLLALTNEVPSLQISGHSTALLSFLGACFYISVASGVEASPRHRGVNLYSLVRAVQRHLHVGRQRPAVTSVQISERSLGLFLERDWRAGVIHRASSPMRCAPPHRHANACEIRVQLLHTHTSGSLFAGDHDWLAMAPINSFK